jgi:hypothetical protein
MDNRDQSANAPSWLTDLNERLRRLEASVNLLVQQRAIDWYTTSEFAEIVGRARFTVQEWCRLGRLHAQRRASGRGEHGEWKIPHAELVRYQNEGLLPPPPQLPLRY